MPLIATQWKGVTQWVGLWRVTGWLLWEGGHFLEGLGHPKRGGKPLFITDKDQDFEHCELLYLTSIQ